MGVEKFEHLIHCEIIKWCSCLEHILTAPQKIKYVNQQFNPRYFDQIQIFQPKYIY